LQVESSPLNLQPSTFNLPTFLPMHILGLGMATLDILIRLRDLPTWEGCGSFSAFDMDGGGMAGTACVAAARLGAQVGFISTAGNDEMAERKLASFSEAGVDLSRMVRRAEPENQLTLVYVHEETGERVFAGMRKAGAVPLEVSELDRAYIQSGKYLHLDGYFPTAALQAAGWAHEVGMTVSLDGSKMAGAQLSTEWLALVRQTDILICAAGFGKALTGRDDPWQIGEAALTFGPHVIVQTEGEQGSYTVTANERFHTPAFPVEAVDTTGAGDVFHGAYLVGLLNGWGLQRTARFASAAAAIKCTQPGGRRGIPSFDQTLAFLHARRLNGMLDE
jgi:sulfofructose kinase